MFIRLTNTFTDPKGRTQELQSYMMVPYLYLVKYHWGAYEDLKRKKAESPNHTGDRDLGTLYGYDEFTEDSLIKMQETAQNCLDLPFKEHFKRQAYNVVKELCQLYKETAKTLYELELERKKHIIQDYCRDVYSSDCPVLSISDEIQSTIEEHLKKDQPLSEQALEAMWSNEGEQVSITPYVSE